MLCSKKERETVNGIHAEIMVMLCHRQGPNAEGTERYV